MQSCRLCSQAGYDIYPRAIFSGNQNARIMIIGQAPGITEKEAGRPFNAGSGTRLFQWLAEAGIQEDWFRATQYMTSVTKCYPGRSAGGSGDRVPSRVEQALCRPFFEAEIAFVDPKLLIPVGRLAIELFFPKSMPLVKIIGTEKLLDGRWIIPLPHPSGASRWHQIEANKAIINQAVERIEKRSIQILSE
jgi:uracil-DNA glycosylase family 4